MSYDVRLVMNTGKEEHPITESMGYTYNVYPMLRLAVNEEGGIDVLEGSTGAACISTLTRMIKQFERFPDKYIALNPLNGWGSYEGCLRWLKRILWNCEQHPLATLRIS